MSCGCGVWLLGGVMLTDARVHVWGRSTFGTNMVCQLCGLLPLDDDDMETDCAAVPVSDPHPSDGCGLCGWDGPDDESPCPSHAAEVAEWERRNGWPA